MMDFEEILKRKEIMYKNFPVVKKINQILKLGYVPARKNQSYMAVTREGYVVSDIANCLEHSFFNLTNQHFYAYNITYSETDIFFSFLNPDFTNPRVQMIEEVLAFVKSTGLKIRPCKEDKKLGANQWKVGAYFAERPVNMPQLQCDIHFVLQEQDGTWSSKFGQFEDIKIYKNLPKKINTEFREYELVNTYQVTNPYLEI